MTKLDVLLYEPVYSFYKNNDNNDVTATIRENDIIKKYNKLNNDTLLQICRELNCIRWKYLTYAHPNIKFKKNYGPQWDMLNYTTKKRGEMKVSDDLDKKLKELLFDKNKKEYKLNKKEPDWSRLYHDGYSLQEVMTLLRENYGSRWDMINYVTKKRGLMIVSGDLDKKLKELLFEKNKKDYNLKKKEPNWEKMYKDGWCLQEIIELLKNKNANLFIKNYYR